MLIKNIIVVTKYLSGQGFGLILSFISSLIIIRTFPIEEFAIYVLFFALTTVQTVGSDLGLGNCALTLLAKSRHAPNRQQQIIRAALRIEKKLVVLGSILALSLGSILLNGMEIENVRIPVLAAAVLLLGHLQATVNIKKNRFNANQSQRVIFIIALQEGSVKILAALLTYLQPEVETVALIYVIGWVLINKYLDQTGSSESNPNINNVKKLLVRNTLTVAPTTLFFLIQSNLAIFVFSYFDLRYSVAELGALGRLGQIIGLVSLVIPFFVQPTFAKLTGNSYRNSLLKLLTAAIIVFFFLAISTTKGANYWVMILGNRYQHLEPLISLAVLGPATYIIAILLNAAVQAKKISGWQNLTVAIATIAQIFFCAIVGLHETADALIFNMIPNVAMLITQLGLTTYLLKSKAF